MSPDDPREATGTEVGHLDAWERHLAAPLTGRKIICAFEVLAGMTTQVARLRRWRAHRPLLLGDGLGTGPTPLDTEADIVVLDPAPARNLTDQVRNRIATTRHLSQEIVDAVERYDPDGEASWWVSPVSPNEPLLGRAVFGGRPSWQIALEDKLALDPILLAVGAPRAPAEICEVSLAALTSASERVAASAGTGSVVWAGDARDGVNGGGDFIRIVADADQTRTATAFFAQHCDRVRVTPMLEGVPCSIHGLVLPDGVVVLRPVELFNLRDLDAGTFFYGGMGTTWDPPAADVEMMRGLAAAVGAHLAQAHGLRGAFGLDGVLTSEGFRITEMNPRFSGGLSRLSNAAPDLHLDLVQINALIGRDVARTAADIEAEALQALDEHRIVDTMGWSAQVETTRTVYQRVRIDPDGLTAAGDDDDAVGTVLRGSAATGTFVRLTVDEHVVATGERGAPLALAMLDFADRTWGTGFGALSMPPDVRSPKASSRE